MSHILDVKHSVEKSICSIPGVTGIGIGKNSPEKIRVYVRSRCPNIVDKLPETIDGCDIEIFETGKVVALSSDVISRADRVRPVVGGVSIGSWRVSAGTLATVVYDNDTAEPLLLGNNHVFANGDSIQTPRTQGGDDILQPAPFDGGERRDAVGNLLRWIPFDEQNSNLVDAAVASLHAGQEVDPAIVGIGQVTQMANVHIGDIVHFSGRTSGLDEGVVLDTNATIQVYFPQGFKATFTDQIITQAIADPGDSGSLVVKNGKAVGLMSAGSETISVINKIGNVARALNINFGDPALPPEEEKGAGKGWGFLAIASIPFMIGFVKSKKKRY